MIKSNIYNASPFHSYRLKTREVNVGGLIIGGHNPIRIQSMTNTPTLDVNKTVLQAVRIIKAGGELVRISVANKKEVESLRKIKSSLVELGYRTPVIADTHFNPDISVLAAQIVEKVRINPGNFLRSDHESWTNEAYEAELKKTEEKLIPLINTCKKHHTALRIGSNHGSLSPRIIFKYGDTPEGMVHSAMEYVKICMKHDFYELIISMKSSNTRVMVQAYRLLMHEMLKMGERFPLHLGVTEAGAAEDGRIKSATGIGSLLLDGLGDTIRVSLTEDPEHEIPVAQNLKKIAPECITDKVFPFQQLPFNPFEYKRRNTFNNAIAGIKKHPVLLGEDAQAEYYVHNEYLYTQNNQYTNIKAYTVKSVEDLKKISFSSGNDEILLLDFENIQHGRDIINSMNKAGIYAPLILKLFSDAYNDELMQIEIAAKAGVFLIDGLLDGLMIITPNINNGKSMEIAQKILQASRARMFNTEFISCPGCGRTLFNLQSTAEQIRNALSHLKGLKIGIMGCIVNGPGEMADADYGYVGAGNGKISLYKNKMVVKKNIPEEKALEELINLIKENGDWKTDE